MAEDKGFVARPCQGQKDAWQGRGVIWGWVSQRALQGLTLLLAEGSDFTVTVVTGASSSLEGPRKGAWRFPKGVVGNMKEEVLLCDS
jgi:hypothetical protein